MVFEYDQYTQLFRNFHKIKFLLNLLISVFILFFVNPAIAIYFDEKNEIYTIQVLPSSESEALRMDSIQLSDQQPAGRYAKKGEYFTINIEGAKYEQELSILIGFKPMYGVELDQQVIPLHQMTSTFVAEQDGPIFFRFITKYPADDLVKIKIDGGSPLPLFIYGESSISEWFSDIKSLKHAPYVQLLSPHAIITLPKSVYELYPINDPEKTLIMIDKIIQMQNELAGFDSSSPKHKPTLLRRHFLVDFRANEKDLEKFYMYTTDEFIGMQTYNTQDLTDPKKLSMEWAIWHEIGHTYQQKSWTWDSLSEISVNLFSLYVQEKMGQPNRLSSIGEDGYSIQDKVNNFVGKNIEKYQEESDDYNELFIKLVMFEQLKDFYGWSIFTQLFQKTREQPFQNEVTEQIKIDAFVIQLCQITGDDLRPFFHYWGLYVSEEANSTIENLNLFINRRIIK